MKATGFIQEFTRRLLERSSKNIIKIPDNLSNVNQLTCLVKQFLREQQDLAVKVEKVQENQKNLSDFVKEKLTNCNCHVQLDVRNLLAKEMKLQDLRQDDGLDFSIKLPSTSSTDFTVSLNQVVDADAQQRFDLELLKMFGAGNIPHFQPPPDLYQHHHIPHTSQQVAQENLAMLANVPKLDDNNAYFDTFSPEKSGKRAKKRAAPSSAHEAQPNNGPYKCRDCEKTFRQKHGLNQHLLTHETNGAFECDGCGKRYSRQESVYRHQRSTAECSKYLPLALINGTVARNPVATWDTPTAEILQKHRILFEHTMHKIPESNHCGTR
ncbi:C2H2-type domain-containing protein [Caenorhabditis elegans]|nr:C2H2-type domain-containing protein [Caenorhabditis elegans]CDK13479.1 C2H2-type domain-containing protein [Caenorhabditis elegans]|eukprot:NP_001293218.1 Zinc finger putative Transcription Factor family [Caenorhabditis elegans]